MAKSADTVRRALGAVFLGVALLMLILGQTLLANSLQQSKTAFVYYWFGCFAFTVLAALVAIVDIIVMRRRARKEQREFLESTLREIADKQAELNKRRGGEDR